MNLVAAVFYGVAAGTAMLTVVYYVRIMRVAREVGPQPMNWLLGATAIGLFGAYAITVFLDVVLAAPGLGILGRMYYVLGAVAMTWTLVRVRREVVG